MPKLSARTVTAALPAATDRLLFDDELPGFALKVTPHGRKVFLYQYWSPIERGKRRRFTIGTLGDVLRQPDGRTVAITVHAARDEAERLRGLVRDHRDPFLEKVQGAREEEAGLRLARAAKAAERPLHTVAAEFLADGATGRRSPRTVREYQRLLEKHLLDVRTSDDATLGGRAIASVGKEEVAAVRRQRALAGRPILANRVQQLGRALLNYAERIGARDEGQANPFAGERWHVEEETREALTRDELRALQGALDAADSGTRGGAVDVIRFLLYSGWRKGEALSLRWDAVDLDSGMATLGHTKTGRSKRPLSREAFSLLAGIPRRGAYVFPAPANPNAPRVEIKRTWLQVRARAGITKPLHALRHTVASVALSEGVPLAAVGAILGHKNPATTARYAKMEPKAAKAAADTVGAALGRTAASADVLPFARPRQAGK